MTKLEEYSRQLEGFKASDEARNCLVNDIIEQYRALLEAHADLKNDYFSERDIRRNYQRLLEEEKQRVEEQKQEASAYEGKVEAHSFVLALIDGDGNIFQDALLQAAAGDGGSEAASRLHQALRDHIDSLYSNSGHWPIMAQVYVSLDRLAVKLMQVGLLRTQHDFRAFAQRFSINQPLFSIIDVGPGKERADHKIREMLRTFGMNPTCRHIIFGGCHDSGYITNLDQFKHDASQAARITLLESTPAHQVFTGLSFFRYAHFEGVFRSEPLPASISSAHVANTKASTAPTSTQSPKVARTTQNQSPGPSASSSVPTTPPPPVNGGLLESNGDSSWASVGKTAATNSIFSIAPSRTTNRKKKYAYYNKDDQRLDEPLPPRDSGAIPSLDERTKRTGKKLCNSWHLGGYCDNKRCPFQHEPKLPLAEQTLLRYKARSLACRIVDCQDIDCYHGHQCAHERDTGKCPFGNSCNLRQAHGMDAQKYSRCDSEGNWEYLEGGVWEAATA